MKLYFAPGACSLADHIALHEAGLSFDHEQVDLKTRTTASGADFLTINPKGYVPALVLDSGETVTENVAILDWIAQQSPTLKPADEASRRATLEITAFISAEIHKSFAPFMKGGSDEAKHKAAETLAKRFGWIADQMRGDFLFGDALSVADCYLFVMLLWAAKNRLEVGAKLDDLRARMMTRSAVRTALEHERLSVPA